MKNGYNLFTSGHLASVLHLFLCVALSLCLLPSCRSHRNVVAESYKEEITTIQETNCTDSVRADYVSNRERTDSNEYSSEELTQIIINRDEDGRVIGISGTRRKKAKGVAKSVENREAQLGYVADSQSSEASDSVATIDKVKKEASQEVKAGRNLEFIIGMSIVVAMILAYLGDYLYRLWKRKTGR